MNQIPEISITQDFNIDGEDIESTGNIEDANTDIEELDSDETNNRLASKKDNSNNSIDGSATDFEECVDSGSDDASDLDQHYNIHLNLNEFLDQGFIQEISSCGDNDEMKHCQKKKHIMIVPVEDKGTLTDCEDINSSDHELIIEEISNDSEFDNFLIDNDDFNSFNVDNSKYLQTTKNHINLNSSDSESCTYNEVSDVENFTLSDHEGRSKLSDNIRPTSTSGYDAEEITLQASDNDDTRPSIETVQEISVIFKQSRAKKIRSSIRQKNKNNNSLFVKQNSNEDVTDVENIDSSDDESPNLRKSLSIPLAYVNTSIKPLTDVEDFDVDEDCIPTTSNDIKLPSPVREITVMKAMKNGDPVAKVMPLVINENGSFLGIPEKYLDKG